MSVNVISHILVGTLVLAGALLTLISALGLVRLPDVYTRSHAATKSATLGVLSILSGTFLYFWLIDGHVSARLLLGIVFVFITSPVAGHLIGRAAYRTKVPLTESSIEDDLEKTLTEKDYYQGENV